MTIRKGVRGVLIGGVTLMFGVVGAMMLYCLSRGSFQVHLATLAILTTTGPLIARVFEGLVQRAQRVRALDMDCLAADDEILIARTAPLLMPIAGAAFSYSVML